MRLLLDTQIFLWLQLTPERLGAHRETVEDHANESLVSAATSWEIAIKYALGRLPLPERPESYVPSRIREVGATPLPIDHSHALAVASLPPIHGDPFDRLLVAQAQLLDIPLMTADPVFERYGIEVLRIS